MEHKRTEKLQVTGVRPLHVFAFTNSEGAVEKVLSPFDVEHDDDDVIFVLGCQVER